MSLLKNLTEKNKTELEALELKQKQEQEAERKKLLDEAMRQNVEQQKIKLDEVEKRIDGVVAQQNARFDGVVAQQNKKMDEVIAQQNAQFIGLINIMKDYK